MCGSTKERRQLVGCRRLRPSVRLERARPFSRAGTVGALRGSRQKPDRDTQRVTTMAKIPLLRVGRNPVKQIVHLQEGPCSHFYTRRGFRG